MTIDDLKLMLCAFGNPQIIKEGLVFTVLLTGEELSSWKKVKEIQKLILEYACEKYPLIEAMRNDHDFFCIVLKPRY